MKFFAIRFLVHESENEIQFPLPDGKEKKDLFLDQLDTNGEIVYYNRKYTLRMLGKSKNDMYEIGYLFKSTETHLIELSDEFIDESDIPNWERLFFVVDKTRQLLVFELKSNIATPENIQHALYQMTKTKVRENGHELNLEFITDEAAFWKSIENAEKIYEVSFDLKAPNLFRGWIEANDLIVKIKEALNNTSTLLSFRHEDGRLSPKKEDVDDLRKLTDSGGGRWYMRVLLRGKRIAQTISSDFNLRKDQLRDMSTNPRFIQENIDLVIERLQPIIDRFREIR